MILSAFIALIIPFAALLVWVLGQVIRMRRRQ